MKRSDLLTTISPAALQYREKQNIFTPEDVYIKVFPPVLEDQFVSPLEYWVMDYEGSPLAVFDCPEVLCEYLLRENLIDHTLH